MSSVDPTQSASLRAKVIEQLRAQVVALERRSAQTPVPTGWRDIDAILPGNGLARGAIHEWFGTADAAHDHRRNWRPCMTLLIHLVHQAALHDPEQHNDRLDDRPIVWIGTNIWPYPAALESRRILERSVFVRTTAAERLATAALVLRNRAVSAVVVDGSKFGLTATRQLQLAAESGAALGLLARPAWEGDELSAGRTRWLVRAAASPHAAQRWTVELLRCKGMRPCGSEDKWLWSLERDDATRTVVMAADLGDRRGSPTDPQRPCYAR